MSELHLPWLELSVLIPLFGALWVSRFRDPDRAQWHTQIVCLLTLLATVAAWEDFFLLDTPQASDPWDILLRFGRGKHFFTLDTLSAPLLPLTALLYLLTTVATLRTKIRRFSFSWT